MPVQKVTLAEKFDSFTEQWSPKIVASVDDYDVKIVRIEGEFVWHNTMTTTKCFLSSMVPSTCTFVTTW